MDETDPYRLLPTPTGKGGGAHHGHRGMVLDADGMVMNHNPDELPRDCPRVAQFSQR